MTKSVCQKRFFAKLFQVLLPLFGLLMLCGCGYSFGESGQSVLPEHNRTLAIASIDNPTTMSWLEPRLRKLLRDELTRRGSITWTDERKDADALLYLTIVRYNRPTAVSGSNDETLESSANFTFEATIKSALDSSVLWNSGRISQSWPFFSGQEKEADMEVTMLGIRTLADRMAQNY
ncbi:LPS assembly lipoprotein LptE [Pseudodesulfovibrio sp.]|uniref:LPS assembly lipoprotein LptE n=1 Tax=unclassified Pseudodesulfovibrio TaxID=2661612 RepID=UPI003AFF668D